MKTSSRIAIVLVVTAFCLSSANAQQQTSLYIDDGTGHFSVLKTTHAGGGGTLTFPAGTGTLVTSAASPSAGSLLYASGTGAWTSLTPGTNTYVLTLTAGVPAWQPEAGFSLPYNQSFAPGFDAAAFSITNTSNSGLALAAYDDAPTASQSFALYGSTNYGTGVAAFSTNTGYGLWAQNGGTGVGSGEAIFAGNLSGNTQPVIYLNNQGSGFDIQGTSSTWSVTGAGTGSFGTLTVDPPGSAAGIVINNSGFGNDIQGINNSWNINYAGLTLGLNGTTNPIGGQLNILDGTNPGNIAQFSWNDNAFVIYPVSTTSTSTQVLYLSGQESSADGGAGGDINIYGGDISGSGGTGGSVFINGGRVQAEIGNGGGVSIFGGFGGENSGTGGFVGLNGGVGGGASTGGVAGVSGGEGGTNISGTGGTGGQAYLVGGTGGNVDVGTNGSGGWVEIEGGLPGTGGAGGSIGQINIQDRGGNTQIGTTSGTITLIGLGPVTASVNSQSGSYFVTSSDYIVAETAAATTVTLPATATAGMIIKVIDESSGNVTVSGNGHTINGVANLGLVKAASDAYSTPTSITVMGDGTNWWIIARG